MGLATLCHVSAEAVLLGITIATVDIDSPHRDLVTFSILGISLSVPCPTVGLQITLGDGTVITVEVTEVPE